MFPAVRLRVVENGALEPNIVKIWKHSNIAIVEAKFRQRNARRTADEASTKRQRSDNVCRDSVVKVWAPKAAIFVDQAVMATELSGSVRTARKNCLPWVLRSRIGQSPRIPGLPDLCLPAVALIENDVVSRMVVDIIPLLAKRNQFRQQRICMLQYFRRV